MEHGLCAPKMQPKRFTRLRFATGKVTLAGFLSMLGSEWLKDGKLLGRDKISEFCTGYGSSSANNNAHPAMPLHNVSASRHAWQPFQLHPTSGLPAPLLLPRSQQCLEPCPSSLPRLQSSGPGSRGGRVWTCCPRWLPCASRPTGSGPGSRSHQHLPEPSQNAVTPCFPGVPVRIPYSSSYA